MRSPARALKTDLQELLAYGPALLAGSVSYQLYGRERGHGNTASNFIVSLTSFPARLCKLHNCIRSLLAQRLRAERVVLYLARDECSEADIPVKLKRLQGAGFEIRYVDTNVRSLNKIYHALADFPDKTIITCDDDKLYTPGWLEGLVRASLKHGDCVVCNRSREIRIDADGRIAPYIEWPATKHVMPSFAVLPMGVGGVLYPPQSLHPEVHDGASYLALSSTSDDLWLKVMSLRQGKRCVQVAPEAAMYSSIPFWNGEKLSVGNIWNGGNDQSLARLISHFDLDLGALVHGDAQQSA